MHSDFSLKIPHYIMSCTVVHKKRYDIIELVTTLRFRFTQAHRGLYTMLSTYYQYLFIFHSMCYICDSRMVILGQLIVLEIDNIMSERSPP